MLTGCARSLPALALLAGFCLAPSTARAEPKPSEASDSSAGEPTITLEETRVTAEEPGAAARLEFVRIVELEAELRQLERMREQLARAEATSEHLVRVGRDLERLRAEVRTLWTRLNRALTEIHRSESARRAALVPPRRPRTAGARTAMRAAAR